MISFTVRMKFRSEDRQRVTEVLIALAHASRQEPGCVTYIPLFVEGEPDTVVIFEQYQDQKAVEAHRATAHFKEGAVAGLYQMMLERHVENLTAVA